MNVKTKPAFWLIAFLAVVFTLLPGRPASAEVVTREQLRQLMPSENDLAGFARMQLAKYQPSQDATGADSDFVDLNHDVTQWSPGRGSTPNRRGTVSRIGRNFASADGNYTLAVEITLCNTPADAAEEVTDFRHGAQAGYRAGTLTGAVRIGEESWYASRNALLCRQGRMMVFVDGDETMAGGQRAGVPPFPISAIEAVAYQCLLKAAQQPQLTGVSEAVASVAVNGHALSKNSLRVGKQTYVPVREFARAMGLASGWDAKTGALTLSGPKQKTVALTAGSTQATVGGAKASALAVPVLKDAGEPVMALSDLLRLTGGRITRQVGNTVQVQG